MVLDIALILGGLVLLVAGGEGLVRGASSLAGRLGISPLVVGLTVVSIATSAPELAVTTGAVLKGESDLAVGNVVGSNISNILLILGLGALFAPLVVRKAFILRDLPMMLGMAILLLILALDGNISTIDGAIMLTIFVAIIVQLVIAGRREKRTDDADAIPALPLWQAVLFVAVGVAALVIGAQWLVDGASSIASGLGVSKMVIGLTIVSVGTSLPELAATVVAVRRGEVDMAVGNVAGSNIANIGLVLGLPAIFSGTGITVASSATAFDIPLMLAASAALLFIAYTDRCIVWWEGAIMLGLYVAYVMFLALQSTHHEALSGFTSIMVWFVLPLVALVLAATVMHQLYRDTRSRWGQQ